MTYRTILRRAAFSATGAGGGVFGGTGHLLQDAPSGHSDDGDGSGILARLDPVPASGTRR